MTRLEKRLNKYRENVANVEKALAAAAASGSFDVVTVSNATAGASQSVTKSKDEWGRLLAYWNRRIAQGEAMLAGGGRFIRGRIVHDFGG